MDMVLYVCGSEHVLGQFNKRYCLVVFPPGKGTRFTGLDVIQGNLGFSEDFPILFFFFFFWVCFLPHYW